MLVLSRKQDEKIIIGENITITILKIRGNTVRIGIDAPRDIHVMRGELVEEATANNTANPVTVEFKSNGVNAADKSPSLTVVTQDLEVELDEDQSGNFGVPRLRELMSKIAVEEQQA